MEKIWKKSILAPTLLRAATCALQAQKKLTVYKKHPTPHTTEIYTTGDIEVEKLLEAELVAGKKHLHFIGEESFANYTKRHSIASAFHNKAFVVDPIDGTLNYLNFLPTWGISVGLIEKNEITEGAIVLPSLREMFISENGNVFHAHIPQEALENDTKHPLHFSSFTPPSPQSRQRLISVAAVDAARYAGGPHHFHVNRSCVYAIAKTLAGSYAGYAAHAKLWDLAGGIGLFRNAKLPLYYNANNALENFHFSVSEQLWDSDIYAKHPIIFASSAECARWFLTHSR